ncbi:MAG: hypothetical protein GY906_09555 [bacterium]|nr:hypothetical protein [bacterium]
MNFRTILAFCILAGLLVTSACKPADAPFRDLNKNGQMDPYENKELLTEQRVEDLIARMTLAEKVGQMIHGDFDPTENGMPPEHFYRFLEDAPLEDLEQGVREDGVGFLLIGRTPSPGAAARCTNQLQEWAEASRLGIPLVVSMDSVHGLSYVGGATIWPHAIGMAATRNIDLIENLAAILAKESRAVGVHQTLGPVADVGTDPRWGRVMESSGEDIDLAAEIVRAQVETLQGPSLSEHSVLCTTKHFPGAGPEKDGLDAMDFRNEMPLQRSVIVSANETLQEHLKPFRAAIEAGTGSIMPYYSSVDSIEEVPALGSYPILVDLLRKDLGFEGIICSDWLPIETLMFRGFDRKEAIRMIVEADTDVFGGASPRVIQEIVALVYDETLPETEIDDSVRRILKVKFDLGLFDDPYVDADEADRVVGNDEHQQVSLRAARESLTLLANDGILPLPSETDVLVAGPRSADMESLAAGWTGYPQSGKTVLQAIEEKVSDRSRVFHELEDADRAAELARKADIAVVAVGEPSYVHTSPWGPEKLTLPDDQLALIQAIHATGTPTVVVFLMGRPYVIPWCAENASAVLAAYYPGTRGGEAIADVLFGDFAPKGKLPFQMPRSYEQVLRQREDIPKDIQNPLYPYGFGLTYE